MFICSQKTLSTFAAKTAFQRQAERERNNNKDREVFTLIQAKSKKKDLVREEARTYFLPFELTVKFLSFDNVKLSKGEQSRISRNLDGAVVHSNCMQNIAKISFQQIQIGLQYCSV